MAEALSLPGKATKRYYSKGGCRECKRRKIKCDEGKPMCWQCLRLQKQCSYPEVGERVARVLRRALRNAEAQDLKRPRTVVPEKPQPQPLQSSQQPGLATLVYGLLLLLLLLLAGSALYRGRQPLFLAQYPQGFLPPPLPIPQPAPPNMAPMPVRGPILPQQPVMTNPLIVNLLNVGVSQTPPPNGVARPPQNGLSPQGPGPTPPLYYLKRPSTSFFTRTTSGVLESSAASDNTIIQARGDAIPPPTNPPAPPTNQPLQQGLPYQMAQPNNDQLMMAPPIATPNQTGSPLGADYLDEQDLNLLANDLNQMVNDIIIDDNITGLLPDLSEFTMRSLHLDNDRYSRNVPLDCIQVAAPHEKLYLEEFYLDFSSIVLPFNAYDEASASYFNPARDVILKCAVHEPFLMAAVLAQGAKLLYQKSNLRDDEAAYHKYLSKCLSLLGPAIRNNTLELLTSNIEAVLVTVLLLTAATALRATPDWRPHLKGARDLMVKISQRAERPTHVFVFCKMWFVLLELLAGVLAKLGGTLDLNEINLLMTPSDYDTSVLREMGMIRPNGFNVMLGYHHDAIRLLRDLSHHLAVRRKQITAAREPRSAAPENGRGSQASPPPSKGQASPVGRARALYQTMDSPTLVPDSPLSTTLGQPVIEADFDHMRLLSELYRQLQIEFINIKGVCSMLDFPQGIPSGCLIDVISKDDIVISWMDVLHQLYILAAMIVLLTKFFNEPYTAPQVQLLTNKLLLFLKVFSLELSPHHQLIKCSLMMLSWPMYVAGVNCIDEHSKYLLMKYFRSAAEIGSGNASHALNRVYKAWKHHKNGGDGSAEEDDADALDIVSY